MDLEERLIERVARAIFMTYSGTKLHMWERIGCPSDNLTQLQSDARKEARAALVELTIIPPRGD